MQSLEFLLDAGLRTRFSFAYKKSHDRTAHELEEEAHKRNIALNDLKLQQNHLAQQTRTALANRIFTALIALYP